MAETSQCDVVGHGKLIDIICLVCNYSLIKLPHKQTNTLKTQTEAGDNCMRQSNIKRILENSCLTSEFAFYVCI